MESLKSWEPCLADQHVDLAFFDGIRIDTDRITEPRWDRVLPILEEEQVFMCRMMANVLKSRPGARVLDIGTGSGVFAIYAAKLGCRVVAIDISGRALRFARENARANYITMTNSEPQQGEIQFIKCSYEKMIDDGTYDIVILAPPYNPTCPKFHPALHADAGKLGEDCFKQQLPEAARLLKPDGVCIGNQMFVVNKTGEFDVKVKLEESFPSGRFDFLRILPNDISVEVFLRGQYKTYLKPELKLKPTAEEVNDYINECSTAHSFALIYFELTPCSNLESVVNTNSIMLIEHKESVRPPQTWDARISLHRHIIEHTSLDHSFPSPALFLDVDALPDFPKQIAESDLHSEKWNLSVLRYIETWLAKTELLDEHTGLFDLILIDTAPWYPTKDGGKDLVQESAVWVAPINNRAEISKYLLSLYQDNTKRLQETRIGPFLHPQFTGRNEPDEWRSVQFTVVEKDESSVSVDCRQGAEVIGNLLESLRDCKTEGYSVFEYKVTQPTLSLLNCNYTYEPIDNLNVNPDNLREYDEYVHRRLDLLKNSCDELMSCEHNMLYPIDLDLCHQVMHRRLDELVLESGINSSGHSTLVGIPVSMITSRIKGGTQSLPDNYRGGIWLYTVARGPWRSETERYILDLTRLLSILYETKYSELAAAQLKKIGINEAIASIFHQIPKDFGALDAGLKKLREKAESEKVSVDELKLFIPNTDSVALMIMAADAAVGSSSYQLLPTDIPNRLERECSFDLVSEILDRLVIPYIFQRVARHDIYQCEEYKKGRKELKHDEFRKKFPLPQIEKFDKFFLPDGSDAYIWFLLILRSSAYHAYFPIVTGQESEAGKILIKYDELCRELRVYNTGVAPTSKSDQNGWHRDISVFGRKQQAWSLKPEGKDPEVYSKFIESSNMWCTTIYHSQR